MHLFYTPLVSGENLVLPEEESKHAVKVLRLTSGDIVGLVDGKGGFLEAMVTEPHSKKCALTIINRTENYGYQAHQVHIAVAPTKNTDRLEWFVEKATEIGISKISFLLCERSERKHLNLERLEKVVVSAMKQSVKAYKPQLQELISYPDFIRQQAPAQTFIAHLEEHHRQPLHQMNLQTSACVLIGPEGDFSPQEIGLAYDLGIKPVTLGTSRLRTETAALVACHTLNLIYEMNAKV